jgi:hypothetical protein
MRMTQAPPPAPTPSQQWSAPASGPVVPAAARPGSVTAAGVILIVIGILTLLLGLLVLLGGALFAGAAGGALEFPDTPGVPAGMVGAFAGFFLVFAVIVLAWGAIQILAGIKVMSGRGWARITGIVLAVIGILLSLGGLAGGEPSSTIISVVLIAANAFVIWALASSGSWFASRAPA